MIGHRVGVNAARALASRGGFVLLSLVFFSATVFGQVLGSISGYVHDPTTAVIPDATVIVANAETGATRTLATDEHGYYSATALPVGRYDVKVQKSGFRNLVRFGIDLAVAQDAVVDIAMQLGVLREDVQIGGDAPLVNVSTTSIAGLVDEQSVKDLPLNGRSFDNLITLNPGTANTTVNRSSTSTGAGLGNNFSVSGNREDYNLFLLNGIEYTGVSTADVIPGGLSGQLLGVDAVREFNVVENGYGAEYGKRPGAQVSLVTMSGSNEFHGTMFEFLRNNVFDARNFFDEVSTVPPLRRNQLGGAAGGPIKKDKTFIFGSYEGFRQRNAISEAAIVPDNNARNGYLPAANGTLTDIGLAPGIAPYFSLWPVANGPELGGGAAMFYANPEQAIREDFGNLRMDHNFSVNDFLSGVYTIDDGFNHNPGTTELQITTSTERSQIASVQETHTFNSSLINVARGGFSRAKWMMNSAPPVDDSSLSFVAGQPIGNINIGSVGNGQLGAIAGAGSNGSQQFDDIARNLYTVTDSVSYNKGKHRIEIGGWFQKVESNDNAADQRNGVATFTNLQTFMLGQATQVAATLNPIEIGWRQTAGAAYIQDTIQIRPNLTFTIGVRDESNNGWNSPQGMAANFVSNANQVLLTQPLVGKSVYSVNNATHLIGPRAGIAWSPFANQHTAIHAGYGLYFEQLDYMGDCCDSIPIGKYDSRVTVTPATFPLLISPTESLPGSKIGPTGVQPNLSSPAVFQYNFRVDQSLSANTLFSVGYVGERGYHLLATADANTAYPSVVNGAAYFLPKSPRMNPNLSNARYEESNGISNYNALQVDVTHRFSHGVQFRGNYTYSKSLDNHSSSFLNNAGLGGTTTYLDPFDPRLDYGPSNFNIASRFSGNFGYALPIGKGKALLGNAKGLKNALFGGWQLNSIITAQTGFPFTPLVGFNQSGDGDTRNPDRVSLNPNFQGQVIEGSPNQWYNPAAFMLPAAGTFGNAGRDILTAPGLFNLDGSMFKTFRIGEKATLQFRAEVFNALNHTNFGWPIITTFSSAANCTPNNPLCDSSSAGVITSTLTTARQMQFALKLGW
ncbi:MAG: carboxypeptidase regulatory-like domain-containing protein [Bryobacteraceae bacterium]